MPVWPAELRRSFTQPLRGVPGRQMPWPAILQSRREPTGLIDDVMPTTGGSLSRRAFVRTIGAGGLFLAAPELWLQADVVGTADPEQIHLQFGGDASREVTVSWATPTSVRHPRLHLGLRHGGGGRAVQADTRTYVDAKSGNEIFT